MKGGGVLVTVHSQNRNVDVERMQEILYDKVGHNTSRARAV
jgi:hypothetical protein